MEHVSLAKLKEWRDETGEQSNEFEETFREIIVLDDDDEPSSDDDSNSTPDEREQSMEIVSNRVHARDLKPEGYTDYPRIDANGMKRIPRRTIIVGQHPISPRSGLVTGPSRQASYQPFREETLHIPHSRPNDPLVTTYNKTCRFLLTVIDDRDQQHPNPSHEILSLLCARSMGNYTK